MNRCPPAGFRSRRGREGAVPMNASRLCALILAALVFCAGCSRAPDESGENGSSSRAQEPRENQAPGPSEPGPPALFGSLARDLCSAESIPDLVSQTVEFTARLRNTDLMLDLQEMTMNDVLEQARADMDEMAAALAEDLQAHPLETCRAAEEPVGCATAAGDMALAGGALFTSDSVESVLDAMGVTSCGYITVSYKLEGRAPESQVFLAGKSGGRWRLLTEMPEMR